jgi:hypothetical protein
MKNKKAQIFTLLTIALIGLFFAAYSVYSVTYDSQAVKTRVSTMDSFLFSTEQNLEREMYIVGFRTLFSAEDYISRKGTYIGNINTVFSEAFFNGTIYGNSSQILNDTTYSNLVSSVTNKARMINTNISITNPSVYFIQIDPWNVRAVFSFNLSFNDNNNLASWNKYENITSDISIEGFEDPVYIINTNSKVSYKFKETPYATSDGNITDLNAHFNGKYYAWHNDAPSFLKRLQGDLTADPNGIESLVNLDELSLQGFSVQQKSVVDYIYFSGNNPSASQVPGMPAWFRLDANHFDKYA